MTRLHLDTHYPNNDSMDYGVLDRCHSLCTTTTAGRLAYGQLLSALLSVAGLSSALLAQRYDASSPAFQSCLVYLLIALVYVPRLGLDGVRRIGANARIFVPIAIADFEGNYLLVLGQREL